MKKSKLAILAAMLCLGAAAPALADWDNIGSIDVGGDDRRGPPGAMMRADRDVRSFDFGGPVERLQLRAERSDVMCRSVDATFGNGQRTNVFSGRLPQNRPVNVDMPGRERSIRRLEFNCRADSFRGATIRIVADVGRYRDDWRRNPDWQRNWSRVFNWGSQMVNDWQMVGQERFEGRRDVENTFTGWRQGRRVDAVALKPLETDARCGRVIARIDGGRRVELNVNRGDVLRRGQFYKLDLPGNYRNLEALSLQCTAVNARAVTIQIFTSH